MNQPLKSLLSHRDIRIGSHQLDLLCQALGQSGPAVTLDDALERGAQGIIVIDELPRPSQIEALCRWLPAEATFVIPFGENPAFDYVKSRLRGHGTIGACAPASPHQIWWGGQKSAPGRLSAGILSRGHIVSSVRRATHEENDAREFEQRLDALGVSHAIRRSDSYVYCDAEPDLRSRLLLEAWETTDKPLIWIDPSGGPDLAALAVDLKGADFAAIPTAEGRFSTNLLYFAHSGVAHDLLTHWNKLCREFPTLTADYLLDAAWAMISSQRHLVTKWMAAENCRAVTDGVNAYPGYAFDKETREITAPTPSQREARRSGRTGSPEPMCVSKGKAGIHGPVTVVTTAEFESAHSVAAIVNSAVDAFAANDGGFDLLGVIVCKNITEVAQTINEVTDGWILYVFPGTRLRHNTFEVLAEHVYDSRPLFMMPETYARSRTATGVDIQAAKSNALFGKSEHFKQRLCQSTPSQLSLLKMSH